MVDSPCLNDYCGSMLIHSKLVDLRAAVGGLKAEKRPGVPYKVKAASLLMEKLRAGLDALNLTAFVVDQKITHYPQVVDEGGDITTCVHALVTVRIEAEDGSYRDLVGSGHGFSSDDKAGGKASTYAWKDALVKGLCLPDADMPDTDDESRPLKVAPRTTPVQAWRRAFENVATVEALTKTKTALNAATLTDAEKNDINGAYLTAQDRLSAK